MTTVLETKAQIEPEIEQNQTIVNKDFKTILPEIQKDEDSFSIISDGINKSKSVNTTTKKKARNAVIYAEGLTLNELIDKYESSVLKEDDIRELGERLFPPNEPKAKSRKALFVKKFKTLLLQKIQEQNISTNVETSDDIIKLKPKPDISVQKSRLINQINVNYGALGIPAPNDLNNKTEGELEVLLVSSVKKMDNSYTSLNLREIGYFILESGASISESIRPELFTGIKEKHVANKENLKQIIGSCMNEYEEQIKKYVSPINILALKLGTLYAETAITNMQKNNL